MRRTRLLMVVAPMVLMSCTASSMTNMTTRRDGILFRVQVARWKNSSGRAGQRA